MRSLYRFSLILAIAACGTSGASAPSDVAPAGPPGAPAAPPAPPSSSGVPIVDELAYLASLREKRPDLVSDTNVCYDTLVLRPELRAAVLDAGSSYAAIVQAQYADDERTADLAWMKAQQEAELAFCGANPGVGGCARICPNAIATGTTPASTCAACPSSGLGGATTGGALPTVWPSGYDLCAFVGWSDGAGTGGPKYDPAGVIVDWKVLVELHDDYAKTFDASAFVAFSHRLADAGFRGDAKTPTDPALPQQIRFQYNNVIVHGWSPKDAKIAESVADAFFGAAIAGRARGVDVKPSGAPSALDWHHFLCAYDVSTLSPEARSFVTFGD